MFSFPWYVYLIIAIAVGLIVRSIKDDDKDDTPSVQPQPQPVTPERRPVNFTNIVWDDDTPTKLTAGFDGDPNGCPDLCFAVFMGFNYNAMPEAFVTTATGSGTGYNVVKQLLAAGHIDAPVYNGTADLFMGPSAAADFYVERSKQGHFYVCLGGPATNIAQAIKQGAVKENITIVGTLYGTSNEKQDQEAADYLKSSGVKFINTGSPEYQVWMWEMPKEGNVNENALIEELRDIPMWDMAMSNAIVQKSSATNAFQFKHPSKLRVSDAMNLIKILSGNPETDKSHANYNHAINIVRNGAQQMRIRG